MKTSGIFSTHQVNVDCVVNKPFKIIPFGDIHRESRLHCSRYWNEFLDYAKDQKDALFLGMGDYCDGMSTSERISFLRGDFHETTKHTMEDTYKGITQTLANELSFMRGRCIGLLGGNHYYGFDELNTTDHVLASRLGTKFLGVCSLIRLSICLHNQTGSQRGTRLKLDIFAHHGKGGGTLAGSTFNSLEKMLSVADADIYLMGHDHKKGCVPAPPKLRLENTRGKLRVMHREPWLGRTGSFLKAYEDGEVSYNVDAGRSGCALGWIEFEVTPRRTEERVGGKRMEEVSLKIRGIS